MTKRLNDLMWEVHERELDREEKIKRCNKAVQQVCLWGAIGILGLGLVGGISRPQPQQMIDFQQTEQK